MKNFVIIFILLIIASCGKVFKTELKGRVLNPLTGLGIENAQVTFSKTTFGLPAGSKQLESTYTDANGYFEIAHRNFKGVHAAVVLDASKYHFLGWKKDGKTYSYLSLKKGKNEADFHTVPFGELKISLHNINCQGSNDEGNNDTIIENRTNFVNSFLGNDWTLTGCVNTITSVSQVPTGNIHTVYTVKKMGISTIFETDFMVQANVLNVQTINY